MLQSSIIEVGDTVNSVRTIGKRHRDVYEIDGPIITLATLSVVCSFLDSMITVTMARSLEMSAINLDLKFILLNLNMSTAICLTLTCVSEPVCL